MFELLLPKLFHPDSIRSIHQSVPVSQSMGMHQIHPNWKLSNFLRKSLESDRIMKRKFSETNWKLREEKNSILPVVKCDGMYQFFQLQMMFFPYLQSTFINKKLSLTCECGREWAYTDPNRSQKFIKFTIYRTVSLYCTTHNEYIKKRFVTVPEIKRSSCLQNPVLTSTLLTVYNDSDSNFIENRISNKIFEWALSHNANCFVSTVWQ